MIVMKKISKQQALGLALICWFGLTYSLYSDAIYTTQIDLVAFWNEIIKEHRKIKPTTFEDMKNDLIRLKHLSPEEIERIFSDLSSLEFNVVKLNMRIMKKYDHAKADSYYINGINEFLVEAECDFSRINHVIYGHTHIKGVSSETIMSHEVKIINDGAWQHTKPAYVEIHHSGKILLKLMRTIAVLE